MNFATIHYTTLPYPTLHYPTLPYPTLPYSTFARRGGPTTTAASARSGTHACAAAAGAPPAPRRERWLRVLLGRVHLRGKARFRMRRIWSRVNACTGLASTTNTHALYRQLKNICDTNQVDTRLQGINPNPEPNSTDPKCKCKRALMRES